MKWTRIFRSFLPATSYKDTPISIKINHTVPRFNRPDYVAFQEYGVKGTNILKKGTNAVRSDSPYKYTKKNIGSENVKSFVRTKDETSIFLIGRSIASKGLEAK